MFFRLILLDALFLIYVTLKKVDDLVDDIYKALDIYKTTNCYC